MPADFQMPKLGLTMEEGTIVEWLVGDGDEITEGSAVLVIETDKTETEVEAPISGRIRPSGAVGDTFACGEVIGTVYVDGEDVPDGPTPTGGGAPSGPPPEETAPDVAAPSAATPAPAAPAAAAVATTSTGRVIASPNARRVAAELGVDISTVAGTGPGGR
ncbi:MAG: biotin/lipoyl-containing protein, partial [Actinomycetota bacterium]